jgi:hypothetical protein
MFLLILNKRMQPVNDYIFKIKENNMLLLCFYYYYYMFVFVITI